MKGLFLTLLLTGCSFIPKMDPVENPVPGQLDVASNMQTTDDKPMMTWKEFYKNPELQKLIEVALKNNRDLRVALKNIDEAQALYGIERSRLFPDIRLNGSYTKQHFPATAAGGAAAAGGVVGASQSSRGFDQELYGVNVGVTAYEIDFWGRIRSMKESAWQTYLSTEFAKEAVQVTLINDVASTYFRYLANLRLEQIAQETVESQNKTIAIIEKRLQLGVARELELRQAQTLAAGAAADLLNYSRQVLLERNALEVLVGSGLRNFQFHGDFLKLGDSMSELKINLDSKQLLLRPDLRRAEKELLAANADIGAARAAFFPNVSLTTNVGRLSSETSNLFDQRAESWLFNPTISLPIFNGGRLRQQLKLTEVRKERRILQYEKAIQVAFREASDALTTNEKSEQILKVQDDLLDASRKAYELSVERYKAGVDNYLVTLDSRRELYRAQQGQVREQLNFYSNLTYLYRVMGGGVI